MAPSLGTDFGRIKRAEPQRVMSPGLAPGERDHLMAWLGKERIDTTIRGAGHSCNGQTLTNQTLLRYYDGDEHADAHLSFPSADTVEAPAFLSWYELERSLNKVGRTVPVLTDYLHLSLGGTLSVGGIGLNSIKHGLQVDQVQRIRLVDGRGTARWCSPSENAELFRFSLAGLGRMGLIDRVVLSTLPLRRYARVLRVPHNSATDLVRFAAKAVDDPGLEHYNGYISGDQILSELGTYQEQQPALPAQVTEEAVPDLPFELHRRRERWVAGFPGHLRMWTDYVLPPSQFTTFFETVEMMRAEPPLNRWLKAMYVLILRRPDGFVRFPFAPTGDEATTMSLGMYVMVDERELTGIVETRKALRRLLDHCCALGGKPYLYGTNSWDQALLTHLYGDDLARSAELRRAFGLTHVNPRVLPVP